MAKVGEFMRFLIITGMSGAGKTQVMHSLEDMGYYCIDNLPVAFLLPFAKMCNEEKEKFTNVAVVTDIRGGEELLEIDSVLAAMKKNNIPAKLLLQVHDELILECPKEYVEKAVECIQQTMESVIQLKVPLKVSVETGKRWGDFH